MGRNWLKVSRGKIGVHTGKVRHIGAQIYIRKSGANWKSSAHWGTVIH